MRPSTIVFLVSDQVLVPHVVVRCREPSDLLNLCGLFLHENSVAFLLLRLDLYLIYLVL